MPQAISNLSNDSQYLMGFELSWKESEPIQVRPSSAAFQPNLHIPTCRLRTYRQRNGVKQGEAALLLWDTGERKLANECESPENAKVGKSCMECACGGTSYGTRRKLPSVTVGT
jgi:hypothetical protein